MQVYLPEDLHTVVKERGLPASELLQKAIRAEVRRLDLLAETERYLAELMAEVGEPSPEQVAAATEFARRLAARPHRSGS